MSDPELINNCMHSNKILKKSVSIQNSKSILIYISLFFANSVITFFKKNCIKQLLNDDFAILSSNVFNCLFNIFDFLLNIIEDSHNIFI